jgi:hypothetical protein
MTDGRIFVLAVALCGSAAGAERLDLVTFARPCCSEDTHRLQTMFDYRHPRGLVRASSGSWVYGLQWAEERDLFEIVVRFHGRAREGGRVQYWSREWPYPPPKMPTIDDPIEDPWLGKWLDAKTRVACEGQECRFTFLPLGVKENPRAVHLPDLRYRRTLRFRLVFPAGQRPNLDTVQVFSETTVGRKNLRVLCPGQPKFAAYNGQICGIKRVPGGVVLSVDVAEPKPAGSNDVTVVEIQNGKDSFAFSPADAAAGPMYVPDYHGCITLENDPRTCSPSTVKSGARIRERLATEPEQTYERASREIPALDPVERQGGRLYLPLAADASWQKFAFEWGGNVFINKEGTKAMGHERARLTWPVNRICWRIGTGEIPTYRPHSQDSTLSVLEDSLPVATARWSTGNIDYEEEAFATLLSGPLSPEDAGRTEQTPAVLLLRIRTRNRAAETRTSNVWVGMESGETLEYNGGWLTSGASHAVRGFVRAPVETSARIEGRTLRMEERLAGNAESVAYLLIPFIPDLIPAERRQLQALDYDSQRARVLAYWRDVTGRGVPFRVPEERFNAFSRGLIARIRISATKDPKSGLYMVPASSYGYLVFDNEAAFQAQFLDVAGHSGLSTEYLKTFVELQGSKSFEGSYTGDQKSVYHGARVNPEYDYTAHEYNLDHGTVLWTLGEHYLITRDRDWLHRVLPSMKRAADWVIEQRELTKVLVDGRPCPEFGLLPAGHLEDNRDWGHWFSVNAYASLGMTVLAEALRDVDAPEATRYTREAELYRNDLRNAVRRATAIAPVIRLRDNTWVPYVPTRPHQRIRLFGPLRVGYYSRYPQHVLPTYRASATRELLYGPLILADAGIFDAREPLVRWVLDDWEDNATMSEPLGLHVHGWVDESYWFSRGGMVFQANLQNPIRSYVRRGEAQAAIRALYNDFVSCHYPSVNIFTEEYRQWRSPSGPFYKVPDEAKFVHRLRDLLVTEYGDDLLLASATPARWLGPGQCIEVTDAPTHFGPVSYKLCGQVREVSGQIQLPSRNSFHEVWLTLRVPEGRKIEKLTINGKLWKDVDRSTGRIRLPKTTEPLELRATLN